jgi:TonB family protein
VERFSDPRSIDPAELAWRDDLTGAWNRRYLRRLLEEEWQELVATQGTVTLLVLDLDRFKEINDAYGHPAGDKVLVEAANQLRASFRAEDRLIRYGGDEFVVALAGVGAEEARALAERARGIFETVEISAPAGQAAARLPLSFSMGVASFPADGTSGQEILAVADRRLYAEKRARQAPAAPAFRSRKAILLAALAAVVVLGLAGWLELRWIRRTPPPPAEIASPAGAPVPAAEIVVRDEEELRRLREEVLRLESALVEDRPAEDRERYEARIRELEARLAEAGEGAAGASGTADPAAPGSADGRLDAASDLDPGIGMRIGERRSREEVQISPEPIPPIESGPSAAPAAPGAVSPEPAEPASAFEPPQLLRSIRPAYPRIARERRRMATVELRVRVDAAGRVLSAEPVGPRAGYGFDESAQEAAMSARFRPGRREGVPVEMETKLAIRFVLEGPPS